MRGLVGKTVMQTTLTATSFVATAAIVVVILFVIAEVITLILP